MKYATAGRETLMTKLPCGMSRIGDMNGLKWVHGAGCGILTGLLCLGSSMSWAQAAGNMGAGTGAEQAPAAVQPPMPPMSGGQQVQTGGMTDAAHGAMRRAVAEPSTALTVTVEGRSRTLTVKELEAMPQRTVTVHNGHTSADETYTGVAVSDVLAQVGLGGDAQAERGRVLRSYLRATGTDFYFVVYSGVELTGAMHTGEVIVALKRNGQGMGDAGALMLVSSEDKMPARWVRNLTSMTLTSVD